MKLEKRQGFIIEAGTLRGLPTFNIRVNTVVTGIGIVAYGKLYTALARSFNKLAIMGNPYFSLRLFY